MQRLKDVLLGAVAASLIIGVAPTVFATVGDFDIPVTYKDIKIFVDGEELVTDKEAFTYKGTTFLPVRAVAEAVGKEVVWDGDTMSIHLNSSEAELAAAEEAAAAAEVEA
ncbi:MAG: stalk domain-containing protein, partial [Rikenellaceae bacterium]